jgi:hypothetical protein
LEAKKEYTITKNCFYKVKRITKSYLYDEPDGSGVLKTNAVPVAGFNSEFINFSWNASGSQIIYPYFDKLYKINKDGSA